MRYAPPGLCLNDFDVLRVGDEWRILHLQAPPVEPFDAAVLETSYGQARSPDLVNWTPLAPAFGIGRPGAFDDSAVWTMHQIAVAGGLAMFYTGVTRPPDGSARQAIGLAVTDREDGTGWRRAGGGRPVVEADATWYRTGPDMAWRDPFVVRDPDRGVWLMAVCARAADGPEGRGGCVGTATSSDLLDWTVGPPLLVPGDVDEFECPVLERVDGGWLLFGSIGPAHEVRAWQAVALTGPWTPLGRVGPPGVYAPRLTAGADGDRLFLHTLQRRHGLTDTGSLGRGVLAQPKVLRHVPGAAPELLWWPGNEAHLTEPAEPAEQAEPADGTLEAALPGPVGRLRLRLRDDGASALLVALDGDRITARYPDGRVLASTEIDVVRTPCRSLRVLCVGEYVEVYLDDTFVLATCAYEPTGTGAALTVEGRPQPLLHRALRSRGRRDDASAVTGAVAASGAPVRPARRHGPAVRSVP